MKEGLDYQAMLDVAVAEARLGLTEGGIPIGAALFDQNGALLGRGSQSSGPRERPVGAW